MSVIFCFACKHFLQTKESVQMISIYVVVLFASNLVATSTVLLCLHSQYIFTCHIFSQLPRIFAGHIRLLPGQVSDWRTISVTHCTVHCTPLYTCTLYCTDGQREEKWEIWREDGAPTAVRIIRWFRDGYSPHGFTSRRWLVCQTKYLWIGIN